MGEGIWKFTLRDDLVVGDFDGPLGYILRCRDDYEMFYI
jgi:hypothetical protein